MTNESRKRELLDALRTARDTARVHVVTHHRRPDGEALVVEQLQRGECRPFTVRWAKAWEYAGGD